MEESKISHELSLKELNIRALQIVSSSSNAVSIHAMSTSESKICLPKDLVPSYVVGEYINMWLAAYEVALRVHKVPEESWGGGLWSICPQWGGTHSLH